MLRQAESGTDPLPRGEGDDSFVGLEVALIIEETFWSKLLWLVEVLGVVHDVVEVGKDGRAFGYGVSGMNKLGGLLAFLLPNSIAF